MENNVLIIKRRARRAGLIVGIASFLGFSILMFLPSIYGNAVTFLIVGAYLVTVPVGLLEACLSGLIVYFIFKHLIKNKLVYRIVLIVLVMIGYVLGLLCQGYTIRTLTRTKPYMNEIDTNQDGKIDKWVHHYGDFSAISTMSEEDIDYDGTPDIKKYYDNGELVKKEYYKNGELIKTEESPVVRKNKR